MKIENRQKTLLIGAGVCLGLFLGNFIVYEPLKKNWETRAEKIQKLRKDVDENKRLLAQKDRIQDRWERMKTNALPADKSLAESKVLNALESWEQASRIKIERRQPQWKEDPEYTTLELNIDATGDMTSIMRFLFNLERDLPKLALRLENVDIMSRDNNGSQLSLGLQLTGLVLNPEGTRANPEVNENSTKLRLVASVAFIASSWMACAAVPANDASSFELISQRNIFDSSRSVRSAQPVPAEVVTFNGTLSDDGRSHAFFGSRALGAGDWFEGFHVVGIGSGSVRLAAASGEVYILSPGMSLRREGDGPWQTKGASEDGVKRAQAYSK